MKLVISLTSPFARKARIAMMDKKIDCETLVDIPWEANNEVPKYNPLGKIPVLILDDESTLYDSRVIVEYFDVMSPVARLIPENGRPRLVVKRWEALADGISDAAATIFLERKRAAERQDDRRGAERDRLAGERRLDPGVEHVDRKPQPNLTGPQK